MGLDKVMKVLMVVLLCTTFITLFFAMKIGLSRSLLPSTSSPWSLSAMPFLLALMGWMPAPIELSVWQSVWLLEKNKTRKQKTSIQEARFDFHLGYSLTMILALAFLTLGACVMYKSSQGFPASASGIAKALIHMYTETLGPWTKPFIALAAFTTMFSTSLTVIDAYPRSLAEGVFVLKKQKNHTRQSKYYWIFMISMLFSSLLIIRFFMHNLKQMIDFATILSFLAAPIFAFLNYKLITSSHTPKEHQPKKAFRLLSYCGLLFLCLFFGIFLLSFLL